MLAGGQYSAYSGFTLDTDQQAGFLPQVTSACRNGGSKLHRMRPTWPWTAMMAPISAPELFRSCMRDVMQIRGQGFVPAHSRSVIHEGNNRNPDILFNGFEQGLANHRGATEQWIGMDKEGYLFIMVEQAEYLQDIMGGFSAVAP